MSLKPIHEFLLWNNCNNNCKFCHQKANKIKYPGKFPDTSGKIKSIHLVRNKIETELEPGSHILFMGGELFDFQMESNLESEFLSLAELVSDKMKKDELGYLYINTNLIYEDKSLLIKFLDRFKDQLSRLRFTTSFDFKYRYSRESDRELVLNNMKWISNEYPELGTRVANYVLTDEATKYLIEYPEEIYEFKLKTGFDLNPIPYIVLSTSSAPDRNTLLKLFMTLNNNYPNYLKEYNYKLVPIQERKLWEYNDGKLNYASSGNSECGHNINFRRVFKDDTRCFICELKTLENII